MGANGPDIASHKPHPRHSWKRRVLLRAVVYGSLLVGVVGLGAYGMWMPGGYTHARRLALESSDLLAQTLENHVRALAAIGPRNFEEHGSLEQARAYITSALVDSGCLRPHKFWTEPVPSPFGYSENIAIDLPGTQKLSAPWVIIGAHYDTHSGTPGANDNASGVAAGLELARHFCTHEAGPLRFVFFTNEEQPHFGQDSMGSLIHARGAKARNEHVRAMISLESLGMFTSKKGSQKYPFPLGLFYPSRGNFVGLVSNLQNAPLVRESIRLFRSESRMPSEGAALPAVLPGVSWSDHWSFWQAGYPALMLTDTAPYRDPHYHQQSDTPDHLDYSAMAAVTTSMISVIRGLSESGKPSEK